MFPKLVRRDIIILLCIKAAAMTLLYYAVVAPFTAPAPDGRSVAIHLLNESGR